MPGQTPVQILQKYAEKQFLTLPKYNYPNSTAAIETGHQFKCECTCSGITKDSMGSSKKVAKHNAALSVLKQLCENNNDSNILQEINSNYFYKDLSFIESEISIKNTKTFTPAAKLQEYAMKNFLTLPQYDYHNVDSKENKLQFKCQCRCEDMIEESVASNKKDAKHKVALKVLTELCKKRNDLNILQEINTKYSYEDNSSTESKVVLTLTKETDENILTHLPEKIPTVLQENERQQCLSVRDYCDCEKSIKKISQCKCGGITDLNLLIKKNNSALYMLKQISENGHHVEFLNDNQQDCKGPIWTDPKSDPTFPTDKNIKSKRMPVTILQEYARKYVFAIPNYEYFNFKVDGSQSQFKCECKLTGITKYSTAFSKKDAKNRAALSILRELCVNRNDLRFFEQVFQDYFPKEPLRNEPPNFNTEQLIDSNTKLTCTPVQTLQEFAKKQYFALPRYKYEMKLIDGELNFYCECTFREITKDSIGINKKHAKNGAALSVLRDLRKSCDVSLILGNKTQACSSNEPKSDIHTQKDKNERLPPITRTRLPVTILQHYARKHYLELPKYTFKDQWSDANNLLFKCECTCGGTIKDSIAKNKKSAKHEVAFSVLKELCKGEDLKFLEEASQASFGIKTFSVDSKFDPGLSVDKQLIKFSGRTPAQILQEYARKFKFALPKYQFHNMKIKGQLQFRCSCICGGVTKDTLSFNKKDAKHKAALSVLKSLCKEKDVTMILKDVNPAYFSEEYSTTIFCGKSKNFFGELNENSNRQVKQNDLSSTKSNSIEMDDSRDFNDNDIFNIYMGLKKMNLVNIPVINRDDIVLLDSKNSKFVTTDKKYYGTDVLQVFTKKNIIYDIHHEKYVRDNEIVVVMKFVSNNLNTILNGDPSEYSVIAVGNSFEAALENLLKEVLEYIEDMSEKCKLSDSDASVFQN